MASLRNAEAAKLLLELPVLDEEEATRKRDSSLQGGRQVMFTGSMEDTKAFVALMMKSTQKALAQLPEMRQVDITLASAEGKFQATYFQNWANGSKNAYSEDVIRIGEDVFEVIGGPKSADRMATAWGTDSPGAESAGPTVVDRSLRALGGHTEDTWGLGVVFGCAVSPDGAWIVSASGDQTLRVWEAASGECLRTLSGHTNGVSGCAVSPDGSWIVSASWDETLRVWDAASGESLRTLSGHTDLVNGCAVSPDGAWVVSASEDETLRVWDAASGESLRTLRGHTNCVLGCAVSPDGTWIVSASGDQTLKVWDAASGECLRTLSGHVESVFGCAVSPDGTWIVSASVDQTLRIWDAASGECLRTLSGHTQVNGCAVGPDGTWIVSAGSDTLLHMWDAAE
ncbi:MAG: WD40 repeat domain-containing protein [Actinobacteria bacterium]|nr:WD40 repeat domain-containing protein [Actinomycetota bacterium]